MDDAERRSRNYDRYVANKEQMRHDIFASSALEGLLNTNGFNSTPSVIAEKAWEIADAMMVERAKRINDGRS